MLFLLYCKKETTTSQQRGLQAQKTGQLRSEEVSITAKIDEIQRDLRHCSIDLQHLDEEEVSLADRSNETVQSLLKQKQATSVDLAEIQSEIQVLLAQLRGLQQKEAALQADMGDIDNCIADERYSSSVQALSIDTQVCSYLLAYLLNILTLYSASILRRAEMITKSK